jgi:hypothetical protein
MPVRILLTVCPGRVAAIWALFWSPQYELWRPMMEVSSASLAKTTNGGDVLIHSSRRVVFVLLLMKAPVNNSAEVASLSIMKRFGSELFQ